MRDFIRLHLGFPSVGSEVSIGFFFKTNSFLVSLLAAVITLAVESPCLSSTTLAAAGTFNVITARLLLLLCFVESFLCILQILSRTLTRFVASFIAKMAHAVAIPVIALVNTGKQQ